MSENLKACMRHTSQFPAFNTVLRPSGSPIFWTEESEVIRASGGVFCTNRAASSDAEIEQAHCFPFIGAKSSVQD